MNVTPSPRIAQRNPRGLTNRDLALMVLEEADRADTAESHLEVLAPAAESWHRLASARGTFSAADAAKILSRDPAIDLGQNRLFRTLGDLRWAYRQRRDRAWRARQSAVDAGWLTEIPQSHHHPRTGELLLDAPQLRITLKGLSELRQRLGTAAPLPLKRDNDRARPEDNRP
ncbi:phage antirepressor KilAC domain-containing protein [Glycomyces luteolus]|uniref:Phage antirepressor KilAC domain-containing protein n=1 Tax=Glycomyces luteolus TaxID=2670330 RepID=A0A9X3PBR0_9ACTN|nr:phage antirepressor KilAC domain-containing protein [Glycomyces luteolus]MDA1360722.1 phage antirepressor KilAC domain-containing protein [Glycomyces luteolus]